MCTQQIPSQFLYPDKSRQASCSIQLAKQQQHVCLLNIRKYKKTPQTINWIKDKAVRGRNEYIKNSLHNLSQKNRTEETALWVTHIDSPKGSALCLFQLSPFYACNSNGIRNRKWDTGGSLLCSEPWKIKNNLVMGMMYPNRFSPNVSRLLHSTHITTRNGAHPI